ncbi:DUF1153 domain-containing protein [Aurantimonas endophytica]|uniref:DUF1153 domain-containing protein n=1 Tax=Aurantimonas endophytica TaxID=1522175 RepID=UPI003AB9B7DC
MRERLPLIDIMRWTPRRKAQIIDAVARGDLSVETAWDRYRISRDEFLEWEKLDGRFGLPGLQTTRVQSFRKLDKG